MVSLTLHYPSEYVSSRSTARHTQFIFADVQAEQALAAEEVPVGCVFVKEGRAIARARNRTNEWRNVSSYLLPTYTALLAMEGPLTK